MEFRELYADEIECRIQTINESFITILLYKDARVDQRILDETVGCMNWQRHHSRDNANCIVSIWDSEKQMWIEKEDTGKESNTESAKGLASDSFKRACFNWGIGRALYTAPQIQLWNDNGYKTSNKNGKLTCYDKFSVHEIGYTEEGNIAYLSIVNDKTKNIVFDWCLEKDQAKKKEEKETSDVGKLKISKAKADALTKKCIKEGVSAAKLCEGYGVETFMELTESNYSSINLYWDKVVERCKA